MDPAEVRRLGSATVLDLQRALGNRSTSALLQRQKPEEEGPQPHTLKPVILSDDPETQKALQEQSDAMMARFPEVARGFCRDWFEAATAAVLTAPEPEDPFALRNYYVALAGNMAWAATSLAAALSAPSGLATAAVVGTSAAGAGAGSGVLAKPGPPSGKAAVTDKLAAMRGQFEARATRRDFFVGVVQDAIDDPKASSDEIAQDELLWKKFSDGKVPFGGRVGVLTTKLRAIIGDYLVQFQNQFLAWKARDDVIKKAREYELEEHSSGPFGSPIDIIADLLGIGTPADRFFEMAMKDIPFEPSFETKAELAQ